MLWPWLPFIVLKLLVSKSADNESAHFPLKTRPEFPLPLCKNAIQITKFLARLSSISQLMTYNYS